MARATLWKADRGCLAVFSVRLKQKWLIQAAGWRCAKNGQKKLRPVLKRHICESVNSEPLARSNHRRFVESRNNKTLISKLKFYIRLPLINNLGESNFIWSRAACMPYFILGYNIKAANNICQCYISITLPLTTVSNASQIYIVFFLSLQCCHFVTAFGFIFHHRKVFRTRPSSFFVI